MMITQHDNNGELSCFKSALLFYLRESHPHMTDDKNLRFSRFDTVFEVVSEWFPEVWPERRTDFCLKVLSPAEAVFGKYSIDDRFESSPACHTLTVELTGFIQSYIEQYGV